MSSYDCRFVGEGDYVHPDHKWRWICDVDYRTGPNNIIHKEKWMPIYVLYDVTTWFRHKYAGVFKHIEIIEGNIPNYKEFIDEGNLFYNSILSPKQTIELIALAKTFKEITFGKYKGRDLNTIIVHQDSMRPYFEWYLRQKGTPYVDENMFKDPFIALAVTITEHRLISTRYDKMLEWAKCIIEGDESSTTKHDFEWLLNDSLDSIDEHIIHKQKALEYMGAPQDLISATLFQDKLAQL